MSNPVNRRFTGLPEGSAEYTVESCSQLNLDDVHESFSAGNGSVWLDAYRVSDALTTNTCISENGPE